MKIVFASVCLLNKINGFTILQSDPKANKDPSKVQYKEIPIENNKCIWFVTSRNNKSRIFHKFSNELIHKLKKLYPRNVHNYDYDLEKNVNLKDDKELDVELPYSELRKKLS